MTAINGHPRQQRRRLSGSLPALDSCSRSSTPQQNLTWARMRDLLSADPGFSCSSTRTGERVSK
ncbi:hypothetical protein C2S52_020547 [Perilla frutescens var. hirtella]|nr:hypothetical protein C2S52_020547 [Perilla frutescens var. hirtella]